MNDRDLETLLQKYRPADPPAELQARVDNSSHQFTNSIHEITNPPIHQLAWPWAVAAAALLAAAIGLHVTASAAVGSNVAADHDRRVDVLATALGGSQADRLLAESVVSDEDRTAAEAERQRRRLELSSQ
jgi:hypothetical protein